MKKEIRILGLDCCSRFIVGVVNRGGLYLDGVFILEKTAKSSVLARKLTETKYFPELRAIMIHGSASDSEAIERTTLLPVITIPAENRVDNRGYKRVEIASRRILVKTRLDSRILHELLSLTMVGGVLPEPVRIAHLLGRLSLSYTHRAR